MTNKTASDYDDSEGWQEDGLEQCPRCEMQLGGESGYHGSVYDTGGQEYGHLTDTTPAEGPFFCTECWGELEANKKRQENQSLGDWA